MKDKKTFFNNFIYNIFIGILALIATALALFDLIKGVSSAILITIDKIIWIIFIFDYVVRLIISDDKKSFIKSNILDLIAIMPFNSMLRAFRIVKVVKLTRLTRLAKLTKFTRLIAFVGRSLKRCKDFFNTNGFKYMVFISLIVIIFGALGIHFAEGMQYKDAIWWSFVTTTTVGYGDISPNTDAGRIIACVLMLVGIGLIGSLTSTITTFFFNVKKNSKDFKSNQIDNIKNTLDNIDNLSNEDIDNICKLLKVLKNNN